MRITSPTIVTLAMVTIAAVARPASAAITLDATSTAQIDVVDGASATLSWQHTITGPSPFIIVGMEHFFGLTGGAATYAGVPMRLVNRTTDLMTVWYLANPPIGTNTISITGSNPGISTEVWIAGASSWSGVAASAPVTASTSATAGNTSPLTLTLRSAPGEVVVDNVCITYGNNLAPAPAQTQLWTSKGRGSSVDIGSSSIAGASSVTTTWTANSPSGFFGVAVSIAPAAGTALPPAVTTNPATSVTPTAATLNGTANPNGAAATGWFRSSTSNPGTCNDTFGTRAPATGGTALGSGTAATPFSAPGGGLIAGTTYFFCAIASNAGGTRFGGVLSFTTPPPPAPVVVTGAATGVAASGATLNGTANPGGGATVGWFRYSATSPPGCDDTFGTRVPLAGGTALGTGTSAVPFSRTVAGLAASSTYVYCALAANDGGTGTGALVAFTTVTPAAPLGSPCVAGTDCASGFCATGVCCDRACDGGACETCAVAAGAPSNGTCGVLSAGIVCRADAGECDLPATCDGATARCPANPLLGPETICRADAGACDLAEACTGASAACPADAVLPATELCRPAGGECDVEEWCPGDAPECPADAVVDAGTPCRSDAGACDLAATCLGSSAVCPLNSFVPVAVACRPARGVCDLEEVCSGSSADCPPDLRVDPADAGGACDPASLQIGCSCAALGGSAWIACAAAAIWLLGARRTARSRRQR